MRAFPHRSGSLFACALGAALALSATAVPASADPSGDGVAVLDVTSDVQGDLADFRVVLDNYASFGPADRLIVNGDLVGSGTEAEYDEFLGVLADHEHAPATYSIGNHEFYSGDGTAASIERFVRRTGMPGVYFRADVDGVPVLHLGSTEEPGEWSVGNQVVLGDEQLAWLDAELDSVPADQPVLIFSHHPLPAATSGTIGEGRQTYYDLDYREIDRLLDVLGDHPNVTFFTGHTHYSLHREDGTNRVAVDGGDELGFVSVNTGAVQTEWGPEPGGPDQGEWAGPASFKQNLRVTVDGSRITVTYLDHETHSVIRETSWDVAGTGEFETRTDVAWPVAPTAAGSIPVTAAIPTLGRDDVPGALVMSVADGGVALGEARNAGDRLRLSGVLPEVSVTDSRGAQGGWTVTGQATDLTAGGPLMGAGAGAGAGGAAVVRAANLGWAPFVAWGAARPGGVVAPALSGGAGLAAPAVLGTGPGTGVGEAADEATAGTAVLAADVALEVPVDTHAGSYAGSVTVSLFPVD